MENNEIINRVLNDLTVKGLSGEILSSNLKQSIDRLRKAVLSQNELLVQTMQPKTNVEKLEQAKELINQVGLPNKKLSEKLFGIILQLELIIKKMKD